MFDELNKTNTVMQALLGITGKAFFEPSEVQYIKQVRQTPSWPKSWANFSLL